MKGTTGSKNIVGRPGFTLLPDRAALRAMLLGISDFEWVYSGQHNDEIQLYAFDILATICAGSRLSTLDL